MIPRLVSHLIWRMQLPDMADLDAKFGLDKSFANVMEATESGANAARDQGERDFIMVDDFEVDATQPGAAMPGQAVVTGSHGFTMVSQLTFTCNCLAHQHFLRLSVVSSSSFFLLSCSTIITNTMTQHQEDLEQSKAKVYHPSFLTYDLHQRSLTDVQAVFNLHRRRSSPVIQDGRSQRHQRSCWPSFYSAWNVWCSRLRQRST